MKHLSFQLLTIFAKSSILDVWLESDYTADVDISNQIVNW